MFICSLSLQKKKEKNNLRQQHLKSEKVILRSSLQGNLIKSFMFKPSFIYMNKQFEKKPQPNFNSVHKMRDRSDSILSIKGQKANINHLNQKYSSSLASGSSRQDERKPSASDRDICVSQNLSSFGLQSNAFVEVAHTQFYKRERQILQKAVSKKFRWRDLSLSERFSTEINANYYLAMHMQKLRKLRKLLASSQRETSLKKRAVTEQRAENQLFTDSLIYQRNHSFDENGYSISAYNHLANSLQTNELQESSNIILPSKDMIHLDSYKTNRPLKSGLKNQQEKKEHQNRVMKENGLKRAANQIMINKGHPQHHQISRLSKNRYRKYSSTCQETIKSMKSS